MSSSRRLPRTLAVRLTLWYAAIFTLSSCVVFGLLYVSISARLLEHTDRELIQQTRRLTTLFSIEGVDTVKRVALTESQAAGVKKVFFRLLYANGVAFSSSNMSYWRDIGVDRAVVQRLRLGGPPVLATVSIAQRPERVRVIYSLLGADIVLQVGQGLTERDRFVEAFQKVFLMTVAVLVLASALIGRFMARRALGGVTAVTRTAREIAGSPAALDRRVPVSGRGDEIDEMARMFNEMLDRIQMLVTGIQEMNDNIAHDLKSPVTRIRGQAEVTLHTGGDIDELRRMAAGVVEECDGLLEMINTMLMISRAEAGAAEVRARPLDAARLLTRAGELFGPLAEDARVALRWQVPGQCPMTGDERLIQRMLANLLDNAIRYTPAGGRIDMTATCRGGANPEVVFAIRDTGIGIGPEHLPHIFERFYRCDPSRTRTGAGLGLSLARAVARVHGGDIRVTSRPGRGSTFYAVLPQESPGVPGQAPLPAPPRRS